jgi:hypothetical protein
LRFRKYDEFRIVVEPNTIIAASLQGLVGYRLVHYNSRKEDDSIDWEATGRDVEKELPRQLKG